MSQVVTSLKEKALSRMLIASASSSCVHATRLDIVCSRTSAYADKITHLLYTCVTKSDDVAVESRDDYTRAVFRGTELIL
jgi:hypothetical protein